MEKKCVMVIDSELPLGLIANTSAVLALTLGKKIEGISLDQLLWMETVINMKGLRLHLFQF